MPDSIVNGLFAIAAAVAGSIVAGCFGLAVASMKNKKQTQQTFIITPPPANGGLSKVALIFCVGLLMGIVVFALLSWRSNNADPTPPVVPTPKDIPTPKNEIPVQPPKKENLPPSNLPLEGNIARLHKYYLEQGMEKWMTHTDFSAGFLIPLDRVDLELWKKLAEKVGLSDKIDFSALKNVGLYTYNGRNFESAAMILGTEKKRVVSINLTGLGGPELDQKIVDFVLAYKNFP